METIPDLLAFAIVAAASLYLLRRMRGVRPGGAMGDQTSDREGCGCQRKGCQVSPTERRK